MTDYQLWHGDCLEEMNRIEGGSIDCILTDLPYGTTACSWDIVIPFEPLWKHYKRVIKPRGAIVLFGSQPFTSLLVMSNLAWFKYSLVWEKSKASNFVHSHHQPLKAHEDIIVFSQSPAAQNSANNYMVFNPQTSPGKPYNKGIKDVARIQSLSMGSKNGVMIENIEGDRLPRSVIYFQTAEFEGKLSPTQKPVALMEYLIKTYTNEGETVLDNTMGSGSTGEACLRTGRRFIGIEKNAHYFQLASQRLQRVSAELRGELNHLPMFQEAAAV